MTSTYRRCSCRARIRRERTKCDTTPRDRASLVNATSDSHRRVRSIALMRCSYIATTAALPSTGRRVAASLAHSCASRSASLSFRARMAADERARTTAVSSSASSALMRARASRNSSREGRRGSPPTTRMASLRREGDVPEGSSSFDDGDDMSERGASSVASPPLGSCSRGGCGARRGSPAVPSGSSSSFIASFFVPPSGESVTVARSLPLPAGGGGDGAGCLAARVDDGLR